MNSGDKISMSLVNSVWNANVFWSHSERQTKLEHFCGSGDLDMVRTILSDDLRPIDGYFALETACSYGRLAVVDMLLKDPRIDPSEIIQVDFGRGWEDMSVLVSKIKDCGECHWDVVNRHDFNYAIYRMATTREVNFRLFGNYHRILFQF